MCKKMKQSTLILLLNGVTILALFFMVFCLVCYSRITTKLNTANKYRYELTYNANRFMNGSSYLTNEVRAYAATGNQEHYDNYWNEINHLKNRDIGVEKMKEIGITAIEQSMIDEMSNLMDDDLNTADALSAVFDLIREANTVYAKQGSGEGAQKVLALLQRLLEVLGLRVQAEEAVPQEILDMAAQRQQARKEKQWDVADKLRDEIQSRGYLLEDTPQGPVVKKA